MRTTPLATPGLSPNDHLKSSPQASILPMADNLAKTTQAEGELWKFIAFVDIPVDDKYGQYPVYYFLRRKTEDGHLLKLLPKYGVLMSKKELDLHNDFKSSFQTPSKLFVRKLSIGIHGDVSRSCQIGSTTVDNRSS